MDPNVFKADSFLGVCSIRKGIFVIAISQLTIGISFFFVIDYLRPSLLPLSYAILLYFAFSCSLGIISAAKKSIVLTLVYLCLTVGGVVLQFMIVAELSEVVHFLPKPETNEEEIHHPVSDHKPPANNENKQIPAPYDREYEDRKLEDEIIRPLEVSNNKVDNVQKQAHNAAPPKFLKKSTSTALLANSFYDSLPFVPHLGETEGESEEVSKDELPPETDTLNNDQRSEVIALYKIQKRPIKLISSAIFSILLVFSVYSIWIILTFLMNKCTNLDELNYQPEQFTPLVEDTV